MRLVIKLIEWRRLHTTPLHTQTSDLRCFGDPGLRFQSRATGFVVIAFLCRFFGSNSICCQARYIISDIIKTFLAGTSRKRREIQKKKSFKYFLGFR